MTTNGARYLGFARILRLLADAQRTADALMLDLGWSQDRVRMHLRTLHALGVIHIAFWHDEAHRDMQPSWGIGAKADAPMPARRRSGARPQGCRFIAERPKLTPIGIAFKSVLDALAEPRSQKDLFEETGVDRVTLRALVDGMRRLRLVRIAGYDRRECGRGGRPMPMYQFAIDGPPDASKPRPLPMAELNRRGRVARSQKRAQLQVLHALAGNDAQFRQQA